MPPTITAVPLPTTPGEDAALWLESKGIVSRIPSIRSRDFDTINRDRFLYYLTRRLGLSSAFCSRAALRLGSWFHTRLECLGRPAASVEPFMRSRLEARIIELRNTCKLLELGPEKTLQLIADEREDCYTTWAWFEAAASFHPSSIPSISRGFEHYFTNPDFRVLGREVLMVYRDPSFPLTPLVIEIDLLLYNTKTNTLWIVDAKTHDGSPLDRVEFFPREFQPKHYTHVFTSLMAESIIQSHYGLPSNVTFGGFIHLVIQKPSIKMSGKDRRYHLLSHGKKKQMKARAIKQPNGKWRCQANDLEPTNTWPAPTTFYDAPNEDDAIKWCQEAAGKLPEPQYEGEPSFELYKQRCIHWYNGTGEYLEEAPLRNSEHAPVNISTIGASTFLDTYNKTEYLAQLTRIYSYATCPAFPINFDRTKFGMQDPYSHKPTSLSVFFTAPVRTWPTQITEKSLIQSFDGEEVDSKCPSSILTPTP